METNISSLPSDIILEISSHLRDFEKLSLLSTCRSLAPLRKQVFFDELYRYESIMESVYFNNFSRVSYVNITKKTKFPNSLKEISVIKPINLKYIPFPNNIQSIIIRLVDRDLSEFLQRMPQCRKIVIKKIIRLEQLSIPEGILMLRIDCVRMNRRKTLRLPNSLKFLKIKNLSLFDLSLPDSLETLCIGSHTEIPKSEAPKLPSNLRILHSKNIDFYSIPDTVEKLKLISKFKKEVSLPLPENLKYLETNVYIKLPKKLEVLKLSPDYNRVNDKRILNIPPTLKRLEGYYNSNEIELPDSLEYLIARDHPLGRDKLPRKLKTLYTLLNERSLIHSFPETLEEIGLRYIYYFPCINFVSRYKNELPGFPQGLKKLELEGIDIAFYPPRDLPDSIEDLTLKGIGRGFDVPIRLPRNLKSLVISDHKTVPELPESLEKLEIHGPVPERFPKNLKSLTVLNKHKSLSSLALVELSRLEYLSLACLETLDESPDGILFPGGLKELCIDVKEVPKRLSLPSGLKKLTIGMVCHRLVLPESISHLSIYYNSDKPLILPSRLRYLEIKSDFEDINDIEEGLEFPETLEILMFYARCSKLPRLPERLRELHIISGYAVQLLNVKKFPKGLEKLCVLEHLGDIPEKLPGYVELLKKRNQ